MAEIKMSDGTTVRVAEKVADLRGKLTGADRWLMVEDVNGRTVDINPAQIVLLRDT